MFRHPTLCATVLLSFALGCDGGDLTLSDAAVGTDSGMAGDMSADGPTLSEDRGVNLPDRSTPDVGSPDLSTPDQGFPDAMSDECYTEAVAPQADISDLVRRYGGADWKDVLIQIFERRHPATAWLLDRQRNDSYFAQFSDSRSWPGMVNWIDTLSHEETHLFNATHAPTIGRYHTIYSQASLIQPLDDLGGFPRSEIRPMMAVQANGQYANTYLQGESGSRGFLSVLDEASCYTNELAALAVVGEDYPGLGVSSRDGSVAFLYVMQLYLKRARAQYPADYMRWKANSEVVAVVANLWVRTHFFLPISDRHPSLGISDGEYRSEIHKPENEAEIEMFIGKPVGDSACYRD